MTLGAFHSTQNSGNFGWYIKWNGPFRFGPTGILGTSFERGPLWPVGPVEPKFPFPFDKFIVPSTSLPYPAFKNKMAECSDSMYECSICWNRRTDLEVLLMHSCSSISGGLLYNDLITVSVPFKISLFGVSYCFLFSINFVFRCWNRFVTELNWRKLSNVSNITSSFLWHK